MCSYTTASLCVFMASKEVTFPFTEKSGGGITEVLCQQTPGEIEEKHENFKQDRRCCFQDSSREPLEYKSDYAVLLMKC